MGILEDLEAKGSVERVTGQPAASPEQPTLQTYAQKRQRIMAGKAAAEAEAGEAQAESYRGLVKTTLPQIGGAIGSLRGIQGATLGAGVGEGLSQVITGDFSKEKLAGQAVGAGVGQAIGLGIGKAIGKAGGVITGSLRQKAVERATQEYAKAAAAGVRAPVIALTEGIPKLLQRAGRAGQREVDNLLDEYRNFMSNKQDNINPIEVDEIRKVADEIAKPFYTALGKFKPPPEPALAAKARFYKQVADNARHWLRRNVPDAKPHVKAAERAINLRKFVPIRSPESLGAFGATTVGAGLLGGAAGGIPGGAGLTLAMLALGQPQVAMALGRMAESQAIPAVLGQTGRVIGQASQ